MSVLSFLSNIWHEQLANNTVFYGLLASSAGAMLLYSTRKIYVFLWKQLVKHCTISISMQNTDTSFYWINELLKQEKAYDKVRQLRVEQKYLGDDPYGDDDKGAWVYYPDDGSYLIRYGFRFFLLQKSTDKPTANGKPIETITLKGIGRNKDIFKSLLEKAEILSRSSEAVRIWTWDRNAWRTASYRYPRPLSSVVLPHAQKKDIIDSMQNFLDAKDWYVKRGILYKKGYLFSGPPGTGKTTLTFALSCYFNAPIYYLNLGTISTDNELAEAFRHLPDGRAIILLEDVDAVNATHLRNEKVDGEEGNDTIFRGLSLSGILNTLDGMLSKEGGIIVMTTNYPEKLDGALIRPGRIDEHFHFNPPGLDERKEAFYLFYPDSNRALEFARKTEGKSMAEIQGIFLKYKENADKAIESLL